MIKILILIAAILSIAFAVWTTNYVEKARAQRKAYPNSRDLPRSNGKIIHPTYGEYPEKIPFKEGMTLMPGQAAEISIEIQLPPKD